MGYEIEILVGKTLTDVKKTDDEIVFVVSGDEQYKLYHSQDCCESVAIDDIEGDLQNLIGSPITQAAEETNEEFERQWEESFNRKDEYGMGENSKGEWYPESHTWTFYKLATIKGYVTIRWYGTSNGYYSESVSFVKIGSEYDY